MSKHTVDIRQLLGSLNNKDSNSCKCYFLTLFTFIIRFKMSIIKRIKRVKTFQKFIFSQLNILKMAIFSDFLLNCDLNLMQYGSQNQHQIYLFGTMSKHPVEIRLFLGFLNDEVSNPFSCLYSFDNLYINKFFSENIFVYPESCKSHM